jgi:cytochrome c oxidase assembly protein subunit 15
VTETGETIHPGVRRAAAAVCAVALLPITLGAVVTTLKAGMAFADWPSSDGHNMLLYPWLQDLRNTDKFVEHGHRLAGMLIGVLSIGLVVTTFVCERRIWVRRYSVAILIAVIAQGLLGGARVIQNKQTLAMLHSMTGALFFCMCVLFMVMTSRFWNQLTTQRDTRLSASSFSCALLLPIAVFGQYILGSMFRHLHTMLHEHIGGAIVVTLMGIWAASLLLRSDAASLRRCGWLVSSTLLFQILLGLSAYVTRLGLPVAGYVATSGSFSQAVMCSLHTVGGMLLLSSTVVSAAVGLQMYRLGHLPGVSLVAQLPVAGTLTQQRDGGAA